MSLARPGWRPAPLLVASAAFHLACLAALAVRPAGWPWLLLALALNHVLLGLIGLWPRSRLLGPNIVRLPAACAARREVALTFDDGPDPAVTPAVLDLLDAHGAKASFFCIGRAVAAHPDLAREIVRRGHSLENHTHRHLAWFACLPPAALGREADRAAAAIFAAVGRAPRFFRSPMGLRSPLLDPVLARGRMRLAAWTRRGYDGVDGDPAAVLRRLTRNLGPGDILLLHDGRAALTAERTPVVLAVLPALLERLRHLGLRSVSLPAALGEGAPHQAGQAEQGAQH